jgi:hypothetical protein
MTNKEKQTLCGGTFFTLLLEARKPRNGVRDHFNGCSDMLSDPDVLIGLAGVVDPNPNASFLSMRSSLKSNTTEYKSCMTNGGTYLPFENQQSTQAFDKRVKESYQLALHNMVTFVDKFLALHAPNKSDVNLVSECLDVIDSDESILNEQLFYTQADGTPVTKRDLLMNDARICFQPFLLGVLHFAVVLRKNDEDGQRTYNQWCPPPEVPRARRIFSKPYGQNYKKKFDLSYYEEGTTAQPLDEKEEESPSSETQEATMSDKDHVVEPMIIEGQDKHQTIINQTVFNQNGNNNIQISSIENFYY